LISSLEGDSGLLEGILDDGGDGDASLPDEEGEQEEEDEENNKELRGDS